MPCRRFPPRLPVAPSRGRGSKRLLHRFPHWRRSSPLHGGVDRNIIAAAAADQRLRSPLHGGVDRNSDAAKTCASRMAVAPSRGRGSKLSEHPEKAAVMMSPLHGGVDRNNVLVEDVRAGRSRPFTGAWIETDRYQSVENLIWGRPFTGAWIETALP